MFSSLILLTVSAFSLPLLENSSFHSDDTLCRLNIQEEQHQKNTILTITTNKTSDYKIRIYHQENVNPPKRSLLSSSTIGNTASYAEKTYLADHNLYKRLSDTNAIYQTTLVNKNNALDEFLSSFKRNGFKTRLQLAELDHPFTFVADKRQAEAFFLCSNLPPSTTIQMVKNNH
ncbi:hypothetical protein [Photobacterium damselae]|uniref:hypothetical protein n=1 Tax=Photobacterium damselae TaxID=38293 RepID=UPI004067CDD6